MRTQPPQVPSCSALSSQMLKLRKLMTEILLDVTNEEIDSVVNEVYEEEKKVRFAFKEPKFKPKRASKPNVLGMSIVQSHCACYILV